MGFIHYNEKGWLTGKDGKPVYIVGINYIASYICSNFLDDFREDKIDFDLRKIKEMGLNAVRIPIYWGFFEPEEGMFCEHAFENLSRFIEMAKKHELYVMPWMLAGVATRLADIPYRQGRPVFEGSMLYAAENHLRTFARRYKEEENILFWDICDEPEGYSLMTNHPRMPYNRSTFNHWLSHMYDALRKEDPNHLVTLGFGEIAAENYGYSVKDAAKILDVMSVTCYPFDSSVEGLDTARNNSYLSFHVKMNALKNKPVFTCEAPGYSGIWASEDMLGRYFKVSLYSNLVNGSTGVMPWVYSDYDEEIWKELPALNVCPWEPLFGIVDESGRIKASGRELVEFGTFIQKIGITDYDKIRPRVAILIPAGYYSNVYHTKRKIRAAMQFLKGCGADFEFVWDEPDQSFEAYDLVIVCAKDGLSVATWERLKTYVERGGSLLHDYDGMHGLHPYFNHLFGVEVQTRQKNFRFDKMILKKDFGNLKEGTELTFPGGVKDERLAMEGGTQAGLGGDRFNLQKGTNICSEYLIVNATDAEVMATYADGTPALLQNSYGMGRAWLFTGQLHSGLFEIEYSQYQEHLMFQLYHEILAKENIFRPCSFVNAELETGLFEKPDVGKLLFLINHSPDQNPVTMALDSSLLNQKVRIWNNREGVVIENGMVTLTMEAAEVVVLLFDTNKAEF